MALDGLDCLFLLWSRVGSGLMWGGLLVCGRWWVGRFVVPGGLELRFAVSGVLDVWCVASGESD
jgi:hypothetical protein